MKFDPDKVPSTIDEAVNTIYTNLEQKDIDFIKESKSPSSVHMTLGRFLRNSWSIWEDDTPLKRDAVAKYKVAHADDISCLILEWVWAKVREIEFDPQTVIDRINRHWQNQGTTALAAGNGLHLL